MGLPLMIKYEFSLLEVKSQWRQALRLSTRKAISSLHHLDLRDHGGKLPIGLRGIHYCERNGMISKSDDPMTI
jgi:hypothetical protein